MANNNNNKRDYDSPEYKKFRQAVRKRDHFKCQWPYCNERRFRYLDVHHIRSYADHIELRYNPDNGITLCKTHHKLTMGNENHFLALFMNIVTRNKESGKNNNRRRK